MISPISCLYDFLATTGKSNNVISVSYRTRWHLFDSTCTVSGETSEHNYKTNRLSVRNLKMNTADIKKKKCPVQFWRSRRTKRGNSRAIWRGTGKLFFYGIALDTRTETWLWAKIADVRLRIKWTCENSRN